MNKEFKKQMAPFGTLEKSTFFFFKFIGHLQLLSLSYQSQHLKIIHVPFPSKCIQK